MASDPIEALPRNDALDEILNVRTTPSAKVKRSLLRDAFSSHTLRICSLPPPFRGGFAAGLSGSGGVGIEIKNYLDYSIQKTYLRMYAF